MYREKNGKYYAVAGTKGYRWLEAEMVVSLHKENEVDTSYHEQLVSEAIEAIRKFGDFEAFIDSAPYISKSEKKQDEDDELPFDLVPCGDGKYNTCMDCPFCHGDICVKGYSLATYVHG